RDFHVTGVQTCALPIYLFGLSFYIWALLLIAEEGNGMSAESILEVTRWTLTVGALVLVLTFIRLIVRIYKGKYREGSARDEIRRSEERRVGKEWRSRGR